MITREEEEADALEKLQRAPVCCAWCKWQGTEAELLGARFRDGACPKCTRRDGVRVSPLNPPASIPSFDERATIRALGESHDAHRSLVVCALLLPEGPEREEATRLGRELAALRVKLEAKSKVRGP